MAQTDAPTSYDTVPYKSRPNQYSHPGNLAMVATLLGLRAPPIERCRVLELGCATGSNLIPMAEDLPGASFVGIDLAGRQIEICQAQLAAMGIGNVRLHHMDILDVTRELGEFDYIVAHGIYSWVPQAVRDKVFAICQENLSADGLAFITYNTLPGWHFPGLLRDLMLFRNRGVRDPEARVRNARWVLDLLGEGITERSEPTARFVSAYAQTYRKHLELLSEFRESSLHHDIMADINQPVHFHEFAEHAGRFGLQFLAEGAFQLTVPADLPRGTRDALAEVVQDAIEMEQYLDFLHMRMFRQSVLCRADREVHRSLQPERVVGLSVRANVRPISARPDIRSLAVERFSGPDSSAMATNHPVSKAALVHLSDIWPAALPFPELIRTARQLLDQPQSDEEAAQDAAGASDDARELSRILLHAFCQRRDLVSLSTFTPRVAHQVAERPVARPAARSEAKSGVTVTNLYHEGVQLDELQRAVLLQLDGTRDRAMLLDALCRLCEEGSLRIERHGRLVREADQVRIILNRDLDETLARLARFSLLVRD